MFVYRSKRIPRSAGPGATSRGLEADLGGRRNEAGNGELPRRKLVLLGDFIDVVRDVLGIDAEREPPPAAAIGQEVKTDARLAVKCPGTRGAPPVDPESA